MRLNGRLLRENHGVTTGVKVTAVQFGGSAINGALSSKMYEDSALFL